MKALLRGLALTGILLGTACPGKVNTQAPAHIDPCKPLEKGGKVVKKIFPEYGEERYLIESYKTWSKGSVYCVHSGTSKPLFEQGNVVCMKLGPKSHTENFYHENTLIEKCAKVKQYRVLHAEDQRLR